MEQVTCSSCSCLFHPMCQDIPTASFGNFGNVNIAETQPHLSIKLISRIRQYTAAAYREGVPEVRLGFVLRVARRQNASLRV